MAIVAVKVLRKNYMEKNETLMNGNRNEIRLLVLRRKTALEL